MCFVCVVKFDVVLFVYVVFCVTMLILQCVCYCVVVSAACLVLLLTC